jgi:hypothetical protein
MENLTDLLVCGEAVIQRSRAARLTAWWLIQSPQRAHIPRYIVGATAVICQPCGLPVEARDPVAARDDDLVHLAFAATTLHWRDACQRLP